MDKQIAIDELIYWQKSEDKEAAHIEADQILCDFLIELGHRDIVIEYMKIDKWYD